MGTGDPDLYKAFCWRFWNLAAADNGRIGVVLPRSALSAKGSEEFRKKVFATAADIDLTMLLNNRQWVFPEVHPQYTIGLSVVTRGKSEGDTIGLRGPFATSVAFDAGHNTPAARFAPADVLSWNDTASLPLLPTEQSVEVFAQLRKAPRLDLNDGKSWRARPDTELHATAQKPLMDLSSEKCPKGFWPVYKGESFDIWTRTQASITPSPIRTKSSPGSMQSGSAAARAGATARTPSSRRHIAKTKRHLHVITRELRFAM